jgi:hypothetical protein
LRNEIGQNYYLSGFKNSDAVTEANLSVGRTNHYEGAAARRQSRASSSDERFAEGVLRRAASETATKLNRSKTRSRKAVARAMGTLTVSLFLGENSSSDAVGLLNRILSSRERTAFWNSVAVDCDFLGQGNSVQDLFLLKLWRQGGKFKKLQIGVGDKDIFWRYWYSSFQNGTPLDWNTLAEIALIEETSDASDDENFSRQIAEIEMRYLRALAYLPERVEKDDETGLFTLVPDTVKDLRRYQNAIRKVQEDVGRIMSVKQTNAYTALDDVFSILDNTFKKYRNEPMSVHDDFVKSLKMILRKIDRQELPPHDDAIDNLIDDLNTGSIDIRATDDGVAKAVTSRMRIKARRPNPYEADSLTREIDLKSARSDERLAAQLRSDVEIIQGLDQDGKHVTDPEPEQAVQRIANRLPQMQGENDGRDNRAGVDRAVDAADKAAKLQKGAEAIGAAAEHGWGWLQYLLSLF